jgi:hypothetical protein
MLGHALAKHGPGKESALSDHPATRCRQRSFANVLLSSHQVPIATFRFIWSIGLCPNLAQACKNGKPSLIHRFLLSFQAAGRCAHSEPCPGQMRACKMHKQSVFTLDRQCVHPSQKMCRKGVQFVSSPCSAQSVQDAGSSQADQRTKVRITNLAKPPSLQCKIILRWALDLSTVKLIQIWQNASSLGSAACSGCWATPWANAGLQERIAFYICTFR